MQCLLNSRALRALPKLLLMTAVFAASTAQAVRIKDVADIAGVRTNHLIGYGLVVGLPGTGDKTTQAPFTVQSLKNMLQQLGVTIPANVNPAVEKCRGGGGACRPAALCQARTDDRCHGVLVR